MAAMLSVQGVVLLPLFTFLSMQIEKNALLFCHVCLAEHQMTTAFRCATLCLNLHNESVLRSDIHP